MQKRAENNFLKKPRKKKTRMQKKAGCIFFGFAG